ncbi:transmembrane protein 18 [Coccinella septempunctata]|uniref:transmembrane protein 18 n=1 Tax=Coccinella septempunctata TaxID=41139 RepID=UPI001D072F66|nr:transmembrane protein 18 [Coccinella septempunctata]
MKDADFAEFLQSNQIDGLLSFLYSIEWRDPWIIGLVFFHLTIFLTAIRTRRHGTFQALLFFVLLLLVYFSESINKLASTNWRIFSRQQYFDSNGLFISIVFSMPILLNCMMMVGTWLYHSTELMTSLKVAQMKDRLKKQQLEEQHREKLKSK